MEHIEVHVVTTTHDTELATLAGLLDNQADNFPYPLCEMCEMTIPLEHDKTESSPVALVLISEDADKISCEPCLGVALTSLMP